MGLIIIYFIYLKYFFTFSNAIIKYSLNGCDELFEYNKDRNKKEEN